MKTVIEVLYGVGFSGMLLQIVPGVPDYVSYSMIVFGLSTAIVAQWRQAIKDRQEYRKDIKEIKDDFNTTIKEHSQLIEKHTDLQKDIIQKIVIFQKLYENDHKA